MTVIFTFLFCFCSYYFPILFLGADIIGLNCRFGPAVVVEVIKRMKKATEAEGLSVHFMTQPMGYRITGVKIGSIELPEWPLCMCVSIFFFFF